MANFTGDQGSIKYATNAVIEVLSFNYSGFTVGVIEDTAKGDSARTYKGGRIEGGAVTMNVMLDYGDTNGQKAWVDAVIAGAVASVAIDLIVDTGKEIDIAAALPTGFDFDSPEGEGIVTGVMTAKVSGAPAMTWA